LFSIATFSGNWPGSGERVVRLPFARRDVERGGGRTHPIMYPYTKAGTGQSLRPLLWRLLMSILVSGALSLTVLLTILQAHNIHSISYLWETATVYHAVMTNSGANCSTTLETPCTSINDCLGRLCDSQSKLLIFPNVDINTSPKLCGRKHRVSNARSFFRWLNDENPPRTIFGVGMVAWALPLALWVVLVAWYIFSCMKERLATHHRRIYPLDRTGCCVGYMVVLYLCVAKCLMVAVTSYAVSAVPSDLLADTTSSFRDTSQALIVTLLVGIIIEGAWLVLDVRRHFFNPAHRHRYDDDYTNLYSPLPLHD